MHKKYTVFNLYWEAISKNKMFVFWSLALSLILTTGDILSPFYLKIGVDTLTESIGSNSYNEVFYFFGIVIALNALVLLSRIIIEYFCMKEHIKGFKKLENIIFHNLKSKSYSYFSNTHIGSLVSKSSQTIKAFESMIETITQLMIPQILFMLFVFGYLLIKNPLYALYFTLFIGTIFIVDYFWFIKKEESLLTKQKHILKYGHIKQTSLETLA